MAAGVMVASCAVAIPADVVITRGSRQASVFVLFFIIIPLVHHEVTDAKSRQYEDLLNNKGGTLS